MGLIKMADEITKGYKFPRVHVYPKTRRTPRPQPPECTIPTCTDKAQSHELCRRHLGRLQRHGDPVACVRTVGRRCSCDICKVTGRVGVDGMVFETIRSQTEIAAALHAILTCHHEGRITNRVDFAGCHRKQFFMDHAARIMRGMLPTLIEEISPVIRADERKVIAADDTAT